VRVLLKQHAGVPSIAVVKSGDRVRVGDLLASPPEGKLGARIHASIDGVCKLEDDAVVIEA
jgi:Na+-translocating ferredoxin:NAD+ oxidoreductase RnfC subunit